MSGRVEQAQRMLLEEDGPPMMYLLIWTIFSEWPGLIGLGIKPEHIPRSAALYDAYDKQKLVSLIASQPVEELAMPRMPESLLDCAIYVYASVEHASEGEESGGSGFLVGLITTVIKPPAPQMIFLHLYAVTNWHVILAAGESPILRLNTKNGGTEIVKTVPTDWKQHPQGDDLAISSITMSADAHQFHYIEPREFLYRKEMWQVGPGTDTVMVGRFITHDGRQRNLPSLRFGSIAMMPLEPIRHPGGFMQESFLIETRSLGGSSGSPVFAYTETAGESGRFASRFPSVPVVRAGDLRFIGVDWGHLPKYEKVLSADKKTPLAPTEWVKTNSGMCGVIPAWRLYDLLQDDEVKLKREQEDERLFAENKTGKTVVLDSGGRPGMKLRSIRA
jgi:hypothetical protein